MFARPATSTESLPSSPTISPAYQGFHTPIRASRMLTSPISVDISDDVPTPTAKLHEIVSSPTRTLATTTDGPTSPITLTLQVPEPEDDLCAENLNSEGDVNKQGASEKELSPNPVQGELTTRARANSAASVATYNGVIGSAESIFLLLPRETRPAIRRMLFVEPEARCTLTDLLKGRGKTSGLLCGCQLHNGNSSSHGIDTPPGVCQDHDLTAEEEDDGDEWLKSIKSCSIPDVKPDHVHIKVTVEEKAHKRRFF